MSKHISLYSTLLTVVLLVSSGCATKQATLSNDVGPSKLNRPVSLELKKNMSTSISEVLKNKKTGDNPEELLSNFDWFYETYMETTNPLDYIPEGATRVTDPSVIEGEWFVTHYRHLNDNWEKQILKATLETDGETVSYTENWQYLFYKDGTIQDARTAAHDLPYSGALGKNPMNANLIEEYYNNELVYDSFFEYNGVLYAVGTYYSVYDDDPGYAGMYKVLPKALDRTSTKEDVSSKDTQVSQESIPAPSGLEFLENTWKGNELYFTIKFLEDGKLNFIQYSLEPLGDDTGFGGMNAHYVTYAACDYTFDATSKTISFKDNYNQPVVITRISDDSLKVSSGRNGESIVSVADGPTIFVPSPKK